MKKVVYFLIFSCLAFSAYCDEYQKVVVSGKKIIKGVSQANALEEFGVPAKGNVDFWYYDGIEPFYVYFSKTAHKPTLFVFPAMCNVTTGTPFEIKAFVSYPNFHVKEVTEHVDWIITNELKVNRGTNFFMPLRKGNTKILAAYRNTISNACNVSITRPVKKKSDKKGNLLAINIFPSKPILTEGEHLTFAAFGTFFNPRLKKISVINISKKVNWVVQDEKGVRKEENSIYFMHAGKKTIFCKYKDKKSNIQEITIQKGYLHHREKIKNIRLLPDFATVDKGTEIDMEVIATYNTGRIEHVDAESSWQIDDKRVINIINYNTGTLKSKKEGITKVHASLDNLYHSFSTILVTKKVSAKKPKLPKTDDTQAKDAHKETEKQKKNIKDLANSIEKNIEMLSQKDIKITHIKIKPQTLTLPLGHTADFAAEAVCSDGSTINAISLVKWKSTNPENVTLKKGKLLTHSRGKAFVYAYLEKVKSNFSEITVDEPELVSIVLDPWKLKLEIGKKATLKAYGYYSDSSRKNIVDKVEWIIEHKNLLEVGKNGRFKAKKKGTTNIYAQYGKIKSLPAPVKVFVSLLTILKKIISTFLTLYFGIYLLFYSLLKVRIWKLKKLISGNPSGFIESLYENSKKVLRIFGSPHVDMIPALEYAKTVEQKFSISNNRFTHLTYDFFEARYSNHTISTQDAIRSLNSYNQIMKRIKKNSSGFLFKFWILLIRGYPFSI